jgi:hypothetical protein
MHFFEAFINGWDVGACGVGPLMYAGREVPVNTSFKPNTLAIFCHTRTLTTRKAALGVVATGSDVIVLGFRVRHPIAADTPTIDPTPACFLATSR